MSIMSSPLVDYTLLVLGFGFVIFFHELGHFIAAKWVGIKVEQFAVGFGPAIVSWRKGLGLRFGSSEPEYRMLLEAANPTPQTEGQAKAASVTTSARPPADVSKIGETEYRLNWMPLGGYVKMLGQDDTQANAEVNDPRSFSNKPVPQRMVVVAAGVVMNVILAMIGFMILFRYGFNAPPPVIGKVLQYSPAASALGQGGVARPLQPGDRILELDGRPVYDFTEISVYIALAEPNIAIPVKLQHPNGTIETVTLTPRRATSNSRDFMSVGISGSDDLHGIGDGELIDGVSYDDAKKEIGKQWLGDSLLVAPDETITAINGQPVDVAEAYKLDEAIQASHGNPVDLTVKNPQGVERHVTLQPHFQGAFGPRDISIAGLVPRAQIDTVEKDSSAYGILLPGDVVVSISQPSTSDNDVTTNPTLHEMIQRVQKAGDNGEKISLSVDRDGKQVDAASLKPNIPANGHHVLGVGLVYDENSTVVGGVLADSPAYASHIPPDAQIVSVNGTAVGNWFQVWQALLASPTDRPIDIVAKLGDKTSRYPMTLTAAAMSDLNQIRLTDELFLRPHSETRQTKNLLTAAKWGAAETRDFIEQFYLTLERMFQGSVSPGSMMGPVGILHAGQKFASKGVDWLIWFLSMISANLAVVNFLPIPIVDGGLFAFLILEQIQGKPASPRVQQIAQMVGLALIIGVFLLVTFHDIFGQM
jgi:regulator of sigma E protease